MNTRFPFNNSINSSTIIVSSRGTFLVVIESFILLVLNITALVGNLLVCMAFYRNPALRSVTNYFILSLAFTDLLVAVYVMPVYSASSIANRWIAGDIGLTLVFAILHIAGGTSLWIVMLVSINRYFRVVKPELYKKIYSKKSSFFMVATSWILTTLLTLGCLYLGINYENNEYIPTSPYIKFATSTNSIYYNFLLVLFVMAPSLVDALCYVKIYQTIRQHNTAAVPSSQQENSSYGVEEAKITRLLTVVIVSFYICWFPVIVSNILEVFELITHKTKYRTFYTEFPTFASSAINPIVYGAINPSFRSEFFKIFRF